MNLFKRDRYKFLNMHQGYTGYVLDFSYLANHPDPEIAKLYIDLTTSRFNIPHPSKEELTKMVMHAINAVKLQWVRKLLHSNSKTIKLAQQAGANLIPLLEMQMKLQAIKMALCKELGIDVLHN